jgi:hypothetical protein
MDTSNYVAQNIAYRAARERTQDLGLPQPIAPAARRETDAMNAAAIDQLLADIAVSKRVTARKYVRKRNALRKLVAAGIFTPEEARKLSSPIVNLLAKWRALRAMPREFAL